VFYCSADLRGIDSHGIARLVGYVRLWEVGRINAQPNIQIVHETPSTAVVDGDKGLGLIVAPKSYADCHAKSEAGWYWMGECKKSVIILVLRVITP
jgi:LDH2 family malate/lactate/ureidoglycolate dehydrogenase